MSHLEAVPARKQEENRSNLTAAMSYAERGIPVFPLVAGGKNPLIKAWQKEATADPEQLRRWWSRWPSANIGIPTGEASGFVVLDADGEAGERSLEELEDRLGHRLPDTLRVLTPGGGAHYYFQHVSGVRNTASKLAPALDVRGDGGYVVAAGSERPEGSYTVAAEWPAGALPESWIGALLPPEPETAGSSGGSLPPRVDLESTAPIPEGQRNNTLASHAGSLRAHGYELPEIEAALLELNQTRCAPPLPVVEVAAIASSISRKPRGNASPKPTPEVLELLDGVETALRSHAWKGQGGYSERSVLVVLLQTAREHGRKVEAGISVSIGLRKLAEEARVGLGTASRATKRLEEHGWLQRGPKASRDGDSGTLIIRPLTVEHSYQQGVSLERRAPCSTLSAPRLRWSSPGVRRLGKVCEAIVDTLEQAGGELTLQELAATLGGRSRNLRRRGGPLSRLEAAAVVECSEGTIRLTTDWLTALHRERELTGEPERDRLQRRQHRQQQEAYRARHKNRPHRSPTRKEMMEHSESFPRRRREAIEGEMHELFREQPRLQFARDGQITAALNFRGMPPDFPRGELGKPKDHEIAAIRNGEE